MLMQCSLEMVITIPAKTNVGLLGLKQQHRGWDWLISILHRTANIINNVDQHSLQSPV